MFKFSVPLSVTRVILLLLLVGLIFLPRMCLAQIESDTFTDTAGTLLSAHTAGGITWTKSSLTSAGEDMQIQSSGIVTMLTSGANSVYYTASGVPSSANYEVDGPYVSQGTTTGRNIGVIGRYVDANNFYFGFVGVTGATTVAYKLYKRVAGAQTQIASSASVTVTFPLTGTIKLRMVGSTISLYDGNTLECSVTDSSLSSVGVAGLYIAGASNNTPGSEQQITGFTVLPADPVVIAPDNAALLYSPYNWVVSHTVAATVNSGAYIRFLYTMSGTITLNCTVAGLASPTDRIAYRIDNGAWQYANLAATLALSGVPSARSQYTLIEIVVSARSTDDPYTSTNGTFQLNSISLDYGATVSAPQRRARNILVYGDSISEGVDARGSDGSQTSCDCTTSYAYLLGEYLDAEVGVVAYSGQGVVYTGNFSHAATVTYATIFGSNSRSFTSPAAPDLVIFGWGTNDGSVASSTFATALDGIINAVKAAAPSAKLLIWEDYRQRQNVGEAQSATDTGATLVTSLVGLVTTTNDSLDSNHPTASGQRDKMLPTIGHAARVLLGGVTGIRRIPSGNLSGGF